MSELAAPRSRVQIPEVEGSVVTLWGKVHSLAEREAAVGAAFSARGVSRVVDKLEVGA